MTNNPYRDLPSVTDVLTAAPSEEGATREQLVSAIRAELDGLRAMIRQGQPLDGHAEPGEVARRAMERLRHQLKPKLVPVINATGIVLHTNLGRSPLAEPAAEAVREMAQGYLNLELDLETGKRSSRQDAIREWVRRLTGAESATAVNNNAAATVLVLRALCKDREVILSRGQLVEIGGSFRIPEIMTVSGAHLREIGTTNITRIADYANAITPETSALMRIHTSNYRISGFTKSASLKEMVDLARAHALIVIDDLGSGAFVDFARFGFEDEPVVREAVEEGADVVLFSGDKLLGGPQAGIIAGKADLIQRIEKDPLMRAFRLDKMTLAALEVTLRLYLNEEQALREIPTLRMLGAPLEELRQRAEKLAARLKGIEGLSSARARTDEAFVGGGSLPTQAMQAHVVEVEAKHLSDEELAARLRQGSPAVMARIKDGKVIFDVRTLQPEQEETLARMVEVALR